MKYRNHLTGPIEPHYSAHVSAMTNEELHAKWEIAAELAVRDARIAELTRLAKAIVDAEMESTLAGDMFDSRDLLSDAVAALAAALREETT